MQTKFLLILSFFFLSISAPRSQVIDAELLAPRVDELVRQYQALDIFSGVVLIAERGEVKYHKAFGLANRATEEPNVLNTRFDIGSMNKTFTKVLVLTHVAEGKLRLEDKLGKYLEGFPEEAAQNITVAHLLEHASGYGDYHTPAYWDLPLREKSIARAVAHIRSLPLEFPPGSDRAYSNAGYVLLGAILEKATGQSYYDLVESKILKPMGMKDTYVREKQSVPNRAIGYYKDMRGNLLDNEDFAEIPTPAGGFYSTTSDMLNFYRAFHYGDRLWNEAARKLDPTYAFYQEHMNSGGAMSHAGGFEGANTVHFEILRDKISVLVFANMDEVVAENLGAGILALIRGKTPEAPALPAVQAVYQAFREGGVEKVSTEWEALIRNFHPDDPKDLILNQIGYQLLESRETEAAVAILALNTRLFPEVANCWDSYGQALLEAGEREEAIKAYRKALKIDPGFGPSVEALKRLGEE